MTREEFDILMSDTTTPLAYITSKYIILLKARIAELEYNFSCILDHATGSRASKTNIDKEIAYKLIDEHVNFWVNSAVEELETPKTCDGCKHLIMPLKGIFDCNIGEGNICSRWIGWSDYYEPKDSN